MELSDTLIADKLSVLGDVTIRHRKGPRLVAGRELEPWYADIHGLETSDGAMLTSVYGNGDTPAHALRDFYTQLVATKETIVTSKDDVRLEWRWTPGGFAVTRAIPYQNREA